MKLAFLYWKFVIVYLLQHGSYLKAVPLLLLGFYNIDEALNLGFDFFPFLKGNVNSNQNRQYSQAYPIVSLLRLAFIFAGIGDYLLDDDKNVMTGIISFGICNLCFGLDFMYRNYLSNKRSFTFEHVISKIMLAMWIVFASVLFFVVPSRSDWILFCSYALVMAFSLYQSYYLTREIYAKYFMFLFVLSDLLVLLQFIPGVLNPYVDKGTLEIIHISDLLMYWTSMFGLYITCAT